MTARPSGLRGRHVAFCCAEMVEDVVPSLSVRCVRLKYVSKDEFSKCGSCVDKKKIRTHSKQKSIRKNDTLVACCFS